MSIHCASVVHLFLLISVVDGVGNTLAESPSCIGVENWDVPPPTLTRPGTRQWSWPVSPASLQLLHFRGDMEQALTLVVEVGAW